MIKQTLNCSFEQDLILKRGTKGRDEWIRYANQINKKGLSWHALTIYFTFWKNIYPNPGCVYAIEIIIRTKF